LVEADFLKIMGCVEKKNTLSVVTSDKMQLFSWCGLLNIDIFLTKMHHSTLGLH